MVKIRDHVDDLFDLYEDTEKERLLKQPDMEKIRVQEKAMRTIVVDLVTQVLVDINRIASALETLVKQGRV